MPYRVWGWRLEFGLIVVTSVALELAHKYLGHMGPDLVGVVIVGSLIAFRKLRRAIKSGIVKNHREIRLQAVLWSCEVVGRAGTLPVVKSVKELPAGLTYVLGLPTGIYLESLERQLPELAVGLDARSVRVRPSLETARVVELTVLRKDPFARPITSPLLTAERTLLWDPITLGTGEDGAPVTVGLVEHSFLIGGESGSGKSVALASIVGAAALDPHVNLTLFDGKEVELAAWRDVADRFVGSSLDEAVRVLEDVLAANRRRKLQRDDVDGLEMVVIDELALFLRGGERATRERFAELLRDLLARGRAAGIIVVAATQKPSHEVVPTFIRDLFSYRLAMRCATRDASDTILGQGWAAEGYSASSIDPAQRGVGFLLAEGGVPVQLRTANLDDDEIDWVVERAIELRRV
jgi:hypothetical protein